MTERYKLIYIAEDAWEHEWDIEDTVKHIIIPQHGKSIVGLLNEQDNEIQRLQKEMERVINDTNIALGFIHWKGYSMQDIAEYEEYKNEVKVVSEIEQLKQEKDYFEKKKCEYWNKYNQEHLDRINLEKENEQLQKKLDFLSRFIQRKGFKVKWEDCVNE